jgi:hypothetical protein
MILATCIAIVALTMLLARFLIRVVLFGRDWPSRRVRVPWRFSLSAVAVLTILAGCVFAWLRDFP